ncbi:MAG: type VI secretion system tip protein VgrG [Rhodocyclaceae bacterium]|nr:type VI secretion system tip protein VgrG [Rhodocyclaceae bacterium]
MPSSNSLRDTAASLAAMQALPISQHARALKLHFPNRDGPAKELLPTSFEGWEEVSRGFEFRIHCVCRDAGLPLKSLIGRMLTLELEVPRGAPRYINGYCERFDFVQEDGNLAHYEALLVPWTAFLAHRVDTRIFQKMSMRAAIDKIFRASGVGDWDWRLKNPPGEETYRVQYGESDWNYFCRRCEERGWHFFFEHQAERHILVISDDSLAAKSLPPGTALRYHPRTQGEHAEHVFALRALRRFIPSSASLSSFDFKKPQPAQADAKSQHTQGTAPKVEQYRYAGAYGYASEGAGSKLARRRMLAIEARAKLFDGDSTARNFTCGAWFRLTEHPEFAKRAADDSEFLLLRVEHRGRNNLLKEDAATLYENSFTALRRKIPYLPQPGQNSHAPLIHGPQTATVTGPKGDEIFCDEHGRVKVQFHWDRHGKFDADSSCWVRVASTWAGDNFGFMAVPRIGQEVLVEYLDGNPDLPIITGRLYNAANPPPWKLPAGKTQTGILTRSTKGGSYSTANALRFEDRKGAEQVWLQAERNLDVVVEADETHSVGGTRTETVKRQLAVIVTDGPQMNVVKQDIAVESQSGQYTLVAATAIVLKVGASSIEMTPSGITLKAPRIDLNP